MKKRIICLLSVVFLLSSCGSDNAENVPLKGNDNYNRKKMLTFWVDSYIIPGYKDFFEKTKIMDSAVQKFVSQTNTDNLRLVETSWKEAYISWQKVSLFQIGKAQSLDLVASMNTYPTDVNRIKSYINKGNYNLSSPNLVDVQGFPALDYLLFGIKDSEQDIILFYKDNPKYLTYLSDVSKRIGKLSTEVYNNLNTTYRKLFIDNDANSSTSSVNKVVNFYVVAFFEKQLRENKIVTPSGARVGVALPTKAEAYYHQKISKKLYITALNAAVDFFKGKGYNGIKGESLQQYLMFLKRKDLSDLINTKFEKVSNISEKLNNSFVEQVTNSEKRKLMLNVFDALQDVLKSFKPDMMSAMSISNTSTDTDND